MKVYGIKNCSTVKKALDWLNAKNITYEFHDFKAHGVSEVKLEEWASKFGWESLINKKGSTWRQLDPEQQQAANSKQMAFVLMQEKTSIIKRPVIETHKGLFVGFDEVIYEELFKGE